jgi:hypothetical protein
MESSPKARPEAGALVPEDSAAIQHERSESW